VSRNLGTSLFSTDPTSLPSESVTATTDTSSLSNISRQLNAAINLYLRMEEVPQRRERKDGNALPALVSGYLPTGAERKDPDELARESARCYEAPALLRA